MLQKIIEQILYLLTDIFGNPELDKLLIKSNVENRVLNDLTNNYWIQFIKTTRSFIDCKKN